MLNTSPLTRYLVNQLHNYIILHVGHKRLPVRNMFLSTDKKVRDSENGNTEMCVEDGR